MIDLTIIVPTYNNAKDSETRKKISYSLNECLTSLQETVPDVPVIIASNNGDPNPLPISMNGKWKRIHLWEQGQCKAVNAAAAIANTEWIMITNDDMVYPPGWWERFSELELETKSCISPTLVEPIDGAPTFIKHFCGGAGGDFDKQKFLDFVVAIEGPASIWSPGFNFPLIIKKELWDLVGGYDINYDPWGSNGDSDLEYKVKLAGHQPMQSGNCFVYHFSQTSGTFHPKHGEYYGRNLAYFEEKWGFPRTDDGIWEATFKIPYDKLKYKPKWAKIPEVKPVSDDLRGVSKNV
jgi:glycosyltransferase involved in cell wall biosynthesis